MHIVQCIIGTDTVNTGLADEIFHIILIGFLKVRIPRAETFGGVLGKPQGLSGLYIHHPPVVEQLTVVAPVGSRLKCGAEGQMRSAIQHHMAHFLTGVVAVYQIYGMVVE